MKKKILNLKEEYEDGYTIEQKVFDADTGDMMFDVYDLTDFPEDATISRSLFSAGQYLRAVRIGLRLASEGYDEVEFVSE